MIQENTLQLTLIYLGEKHQVMVNTSAYYSLMTLISHHLAIPGFGLCSGMGSCGTCLVQLVDPISCVKRQVLACGTKVDHQLSNTSIVIPDKVY